MQTLNYHGPAEPEAGNKQNISGGIADGTANGTKIGTVNAKDMIMKMWYIDIVQNCGQHQTPALMHAKAPFLIAAKAM